MHPCVCVHAGVRVWAEAVSSPRCALSALDLSDCEAGDAAAFALGQVRLHGCLHIVGVGSHAVSLELHAGSHMCAGLAVCAGLVGPNLWGLKGLRLISMLLS